MPEQDAGRPLTEAERKEVFKALVEAQDQGMPVARSRKAVTKQFGLSEQRLRQIEREGIDAEWPPLG